MTGTSTNGCEAQTDWTTLLFSRPPDDQDSPILVDAAVPARTISWKQYATVVKNVATGLRKAGLKDQDCVALLSDNDIYYYVLGDAVLAAGGIFCAMQTSEKPAELRHQLNAATAQWLFASPRLLDVALEAALDVGMRAANVIVYDPPGLDDYAGPQDSLSQLLQTEGKDWQNPNADKDPRTIMAYRMFSSGTTGLPKAVNISHAAHVTSVAKLQTGPTPRINNLVVLPVHHMSGLVACHGAIAGLQTTFIASPKETKEIPTIVDLIRRFNIASLLLPPRFLTPFAECIHSGTRSFEDLASLQGVRSAGSAVDPQSAELFQHTFPNIAFRVPYGATEAGSVVRMPGPHEYKPGCVGHVANDVEVKFIDPDTLEVVKDGEICVRSSQLFSGYNNDPGATKSAMLPDPNGNWFRTGDRGHIDLETGQLAVTGRYKEIFKVANNHVSPEEVERVLLGLAAVEDAAIGPVPARNDPNELEVRAYVVLRKEAKTSTPQDIVEFVAGKLSKYKVPTGGVIFCDEIPRNALKKVIRRQLKDVVALDSSVERLCLKGA